MQLDINKYKDLYGYEIYAYENGKDYLKLSFGEYVDLHNKVDKAILDGWSPSQTSIDNYVTSLTNRFNTLIDSTKVS